MEPKKNPKADLNSDSGLHFLIGLTLVLFITWRALEHKTYQKEKHIVETMNVADDIEEDVPAVEQIQTIPPPPPPVTPDIIDIVEDTEEIEETVIESTEMSQETVIEDMVMSVDDVEVGEEEEEISVPFFIIENVPIYPGCEAMKTNEERKDCFQKMVQEHIKKKFKYPATAAELGVQGRVYVQFVIDTKGFITEIRTRGPDANLEKEGLRIVALLPQMTPGMQRKRAVRVPYSIPITFKLQQ